MDCGLNSVVTLSYFKFWEYTTAKKTKQRVAVFSPELLQTSFCYQSAESVVFTQNCDNNRTSRTARCILPELGQFTLTTAKYRIRLWQTNWPASQVSAWVGWKAKDWQVKRRWGHWGEVWAERSSLSSFNIINTTHGYRPIQKTYIVTLLATVLVNQ